jgi:ABC-type multidrug transport system fused ATPase/permease subunit
LRYTHQSLGRVRRFEARIGPAEAGLERGRRFAGLEQGITLDDVSFAYANESAPGSEAASAGQAGHASQANQGVADPDVDKAAVRPAGSVGESPDSPSAENGNEHSPITLAGINLTVKKGEILALVGRSGAGKSTIADIIGTLSQAQSGQVRFDDCDLEQIDVRSVRTKIAYVPQSPVLFDDTIRANLLFGLADEPSQQAIDNILEQCGCDFVHEFPNGLETQVGYRGDRLSGGQKQRVAIARELLREPEVVIMDEPTSALDGHSENFLVEELNRLKRNAAVVLIAHRISSIRFADTIAVIDAGRIVCSGDSESVRENPAFKRLFGDVAPVVAK